MRVLVIGSNRISEMTLALDSIKIPYRKVQYKRIRDIFVFLYNLFRATYRSKFDLVMFDIFIIAGPFAYIISKIYKIPLFIRLRGDVIYETQSSKRSFLVKRNLFMFFIYSLTLKIVKFLLDKSDAIISVSDYLKSCLPCELQSKCYVCPTPIKSDKFDYVNTKKQKDDNSFIMLTVSNFNYYEKAIALCDALQEITEFMKGSKAHQTRWIIVGGGRYLYIVQNQLKKYNVDVHFTGYIKDVGAYYKNADVFLYFSYLDAYPNVILEAQLTGIPVITNNGYGMDNQIIDGKDGIVVDIKEQDSIKKNLEMLLKNKSERESIGKYGRNKILQKNNPINVGKTFEDIFFKILKG
jgi:glycosyltransferase involved in cell wall biosynthesis